MYSAASSGRESTAFARHVLAVGRDLYMPFLQGTRDSRARGDKAFVIDTYGEEVSYLSRPYPLQAASMVADRIEAQLSAAERASVQSWLGDRGLDAYTASS